MSKVNIKHAKNVERNETDLYRSLYRSICSSLHVVERKHSSSVPDDSSPPVPVLCYHSDQLEMIKLDLVTEVVSSDLPGLEHEVSRLLAGIRVDTDELLVKRFGRSFLFHRLSLDLIAGDVLEGAAVAPVLCHLRYRLESVVRGSLYVSLGIRFREPADLAVEFSSQPSWLMVLTRVDHDDVRGPEGQLVLVPGLVVVQSTVLDVLREVSGRGWGRSWFLLHLRVRRSGRSGHALTRLIFEGIFVKTVGDWRRRLSEEKAAEVGG